MDKNTFGKILAMHRKEYGVKQKDFLSVLELNGIKIKSSAYSSWETGTSLPNALQFLTLCRIFGIKDIYTEFIGPNDVNPFSELNEEGIAKAMDYISLLANSGKYARKSPDIVPFTEYREMKVFNLPASAGTGSFLDGEDYTLVAARDIPTEADFGLHVSGDSMEPLFHDGQLIWVHQAETLENGEIGIFYLDGNAYIKKLQNDSKGTFLISLNQKYKPIPVTENSTFLTFGKVVSL